MIRVYLILSFILGVYVGLRIAGYQVVVVDDGLNALVAHAILTLPGWLTP